MIPAEIRQVSTIWKYIVEGWIDDLVANPDGIVIGQELLAPSRSRWEIIFL